MKRRFLAAVLILLGGPSAILAGDSRGDLETFFEAKIRPVLAGTCAKCHGVQKAGNRLRLDSREGTLKGGDSGAAIVPGDPERSLLIEAMRNSGDLKMPPDEPLGKEVVADFERWIREGAVWSNPKPGATDPFRQRGHWAFQPLAEVAVPNNSHRAWPESAIDQFIFAGYQEQGLKPVKVADKPTLLRRACFDLTGLPPTPEQSTEFLSDDSPDAYERLIDRLLDSVQYGERWGRYWMDVVHYCDTGGDNADCPVSELHLYRDYIIDSFNADKPFDQFVREQVAGDILAKTGPGERYAEQVIATGFVALARNYGTSPIEKIHLKIEDTLETLGSAVLGLNFRCARCHDHKFDPVTSADYYRLYAIFASTKYPWVGAEQFTSDGMQRLNFAPMLPPAEAEPRIAAYQEKVRALEARLKQAQMEKASEAALKQLKAELRRLKRPGFPDDTPAAYAVSDGPPVITQIQLSGDPVTRGDIVTADVPAFLAPATKIAFPSDSSGRLQLADWLVDEKNPLTARVIVNRIWQHHFGRGIVNTPSNFGLSGEPPSHPELLDWLTRQFIDGGWSIKKMHRQIMLSKTYRLSSHFVAANAAVDPDNRRWWRFDRRRLDAEALRDSLLLVSGQLDLTRPGAHPFPPLESWKYSMAEPFTAVYPSNHRSVYLMTQRLQRHPYLALFDGADPCVTTSNRTESTVPSQALFLTNSEFIQTAADGMGSRLVASDGRPERRIELAHQWAYSRPASESEVRRGTDFVARYTQRLRETKVPAEKAEQLAWRGYAKTILAANEFRYID